MTATDELRRMLDERGVKHEGSERSVRWRDRNGVIMQAFPLTSGELGLEVWSCTPEQAIAATLGVSDATPTRQGVAGTCKADETDVIKCWVKCKDEPSTEHVELIHVMECSACGGTYEYVNGSYEYCPRCGAKVIG